MEKFNKKRLSIPRRKMTEKIKGIVNAVSTIKEHNGSPQIGWTLKANPKKWYNALGEEAELTALLNTIIKSGNEIEFNFDTLGSEVSGLVKIKDAPEKPKSEQKSDKWEDDIVNFETLLKDAHDKGLDEIATELITVDLEKRYALFKCKVHGKKGFFEAHGDATSDNIKGEFIKPHFIRMAETRAICRALRWYTNNASCSEEEKK